MVKSDSITVGRPDRNGWKVQAGAGKEIGFGDGTVRHASPDVCEGP
jgi:hypothetical protein